MSVIELKRKARKRFGPQPGFTVDTEWNLVRVGRSPRIGIGRPFGSHRRIPFGQFGPARNMVGRTIKHDYITEAIRLNPDLDEGLALHLEEAPEREIAHWLGLCDGACREVEARSKCIPSDTYWRYMRELRRHQESSNRDVPSS